MAENCTIPARGIRPDTARAALEHHLLGDAGRDLRRPLWTLTADGFP